ncbi:hypothetical protein [Kitasatospora sp. NPDC088134]|uniref:hypothetical protein n=1 Tax=Kitasatospora sp. NPDC088134 TaxID=3364071 RepID=UPI00380074F5
MTAPDRTPTTHGFEQRLGEHLVALAAERLPGDGPAPRRSVLRRPVFAALAVGASALAAALVLPAALGGEHGGNAAYAVTQEDDGTILLELRDPAGLDGMVAELRKHGVKAVGLETAHTPAECPLPEPKGEAATANVVKGGFGTAPGTVRIDPGAVPAGRTLLLTTWHGNGWQIVFSALVVEQVPTCVPPLVHTVPADAPFPPDGAVPAPSGSAAPSPAGTPVPAQG